MTMRASMYQTKVRDTVDRLVFLATFIVGVAGTIILKSGYVNAGAFILAAYPVIVLCCYALYGALNQASTVEPETVGDNCYYLGFLFTLSSLAITLYRVHQAGDDGVGRQFDIAEVISGFGVALTSTIVGVLLRVLFFQMRPDLVAADRQARTELSQGVREFRQQMAMISRELKGLSTEFAQHVSERNAKLMDIVEAQQERSDEDLKKRLDAIATAFERLPTELSEKFSTGMRDGVEGATRDLAKATSELKSSLDDLSAMQQVGAISVKNSSSDLKDALAMFEDSIVVFKDKIDEGSTSISEVSEKLLQNQVNIDEIVAKLDERILKALEKRRWWFRRGNR